MSAFMVSNETLSMLANLIERYYVSNDSMGFYFPEELTIELVDTGYCAEEVFKKLVNLNIHSLAQRYPEDYMEMVGYVEFNPQFDIWSFTGGMVKPWHYQFLKSLRCYLYQCCEGDCYETTLYKALDKLSMELAYFIATRQPEYDLADWK